MSAFCKNVASVRLPEICLIIFTVVKAFLTYCSDREFALGKEVSVESRSGEALSHADCCVLLTEQRCVCLSVCCPDKRSQAATGEALWLKAFISLHVLEVVQQDFLCASAGGVRVYFNHSMTASWALWCGDTFSEMCVTDTLHPHFYCLIVAAGTSFGEGVLVVSTGRYHR